MWRPGIIPSAKGGVMLGGLGLIIAAVFFISWRKSAKSWQRTVAWLAAAWAAISILFYVFVFGMMSTQ
jgi:hypothetical protein